MVDLLHLADRRLDQLSGGERRRALIAKALCQQAPMILLDEPDAHLDLAQQAKLIELLHSLNDVTLLIVSHDLSFLSACCRNLAILDEGRITHSGPLETILTKEHLQDLFGPAISSGRDPSGTHYAVSRGRSPESGS
jgi:iron complex transport system ATP-binding protein